MYNLKSKNMKTIEITKTGVAKNGNNWIIGQTFEGDFVVSYIAFLKSDADMEQYSVGSSVEVPTAALKSMS